MYISAAKKYYYLTMWAMTKKIKGQYYVYAYRTEWKNGRPKSIYVDYLGPKNQLTDQETKEKLKALEKTVV